MHPFSKIEFLTNFKNRYLYTKMRTIEFLFCIVLNIIMFFMQSNNSLEGKAFVSQMQSFVAVYLAFRFGIVGISISLLFSLKDFAFILIECINNYHYNYLIGLISTFISIVWVLIIGIISIKQENNKRRIQELAITDDLTEVYNQRYFNSTLTKEIADASKNNNTVGLILIDIDNFKMHNDLYGHDYGDTILINTAAILKKIIGEKHSLFRVSGDEFAVLVKNYDIKLLENEAKLIYEEYEKIKAEYYKDDLGYRITFSIGLSQYPNISDNKEELISHANTALYQAKNMGEDKVNFYQDIMLQVHKNMKSDQQLVGVFKGLLSTIVAKDKYTVGHCERVSSYAVMMGEALGLELKEIQILLYAGLLHDIGKIELPRSILNKLGSLTEDEFALIRQHPVFSANILEPLSGMPNLIDYVKHHHERFDGKGYPDGIAGEKISLGARILCIADSFDAMISDRPYRKSMTVEEAFWELERCSGTQFDPALAKLFIKAMKNKMSIKYNYKVDSSFLEYSVFEGALK